MSGPNCSQLRMFGKHFAKLGNRNIRTQPWLLKVEGSKLRSRSLGKNKLGAEYLFHVSMLVIPVHDNFSDVLKLDVLLFKAFWLLGIDKTWLSKGYPGRLMSFERSESAYTMLSHTKSTSELGRGLSHIIFDARPLPDDLDQLQDPNMFWIEWWSVAYLSSRVSWLLNIPAGFYLSVSCFSWQEMERQLADFEAQQEAVGHPICTVGPKKISRLVIFFKV